MSEATLHRMRFTDDADQLAELLRAAGHGDATVDDEAYGRVLVVTDPGDRRPQVDGRADDLHGHHESDPSDISDAAPRWPVRALLVTPDVERYRQFPDASA